MRKITTSIPLPAAAIDFRPCPESIAKNAIILNVALWPGPGVSVLEATAVVHLDSEAHFDGRPGERKPRRMDPGLLVVDVDVMEACELLEFLSEADTIACRDTEHVNNALERIFALAQNRVALRLVRSTIWVDRGAGATLLNLAFQDGRMPANLPFGLWTILPLGA